MGSNVSAVTNLIPTVNEGFSTTVASPGVTSGGAAVPLASVGGLLNGSVFAGIIEPGLTNQQEFTGTVDTAGSQITGVVWTRGANVAHATGVTVVDYTTGTAFNMMGRHALVHANQDGTLKTNIVTTAAITDASVTTTKLAAGAVTNAKLDTTAGAPGGAWASWTPTIGGFTLGNGTIDFAKYVQIGKTVHFKASVTLGTTSAITGAVSINFPVTSTGENFTAPGFASYYDASASTVYYGQLRTSNSTTAFAYAVNAASTYGFVTTWNTTIPVAYGLADNMSFSGTYEAA